MMNEEEKFDELLSSKLSERDFPFDELNWDEAERLIIQQEKKEKTTRFAFIFSAGLSAGVLIMLPFMMNTHASLPKPYRLIIQRSTKIPLYKIIFLHLSIMPGEIQVLAKKKISTTAWAACFSKKSNLHLNASSNSAANARRQGIKYLFKCE